MSRHTQRPMDERFWEVVEKTATCWVWTGHHDSSGYGSAYTTGRRYVLAHRWAYESVNGPVPRGLELDHLCRVRLCVRPDHLEAVTHLENMRRSSIATRTHCASGHEYTPENTRVHVKANGWSRRYCRTCEKRWAADYRARKAA
jgi:hypothetical protein